MTARPLIIIPVHNRRETTLGCVGHLEADGVLAWADVIVVDDGSRDGTAEAVRARFPGVEILSGSGDLFWTGAMALGMRRATERQSDPILWLNDDTAPTPGALRRLVDAARETGAIVTGECRIPPAGPVIYGGLVSRGVALHVRPATSASPEPVDAVCGNLVAIPAAVVARIGYPDGAHLPHAFGDSDYALRARRAGVPVLVDPRVTAFAAPNALGNYASWLLSDISIRGIWAQLSDKRSYAYAPAHFTFLRRHFGWRGAVYWGWTILKRAIISGVRLVVPQAVLRRVWGRRSRVWQDEQAIRAAMGKTKQ